MAVNFNRNLIGGITTIYEEKRREIFDRDGITVVRTLLVRPYENRLAVIEDLLGSVKQIGWTLLRTAPGKDPWYPWCYAVSVDEEGVGSLTGSNANDPDHSGNKNRYEGGARLVVTYKTIDGEEEASENYDFGATQLTLPNKRFGWYDSPGQPVQDLLLKSDTNVAKTMPRIQYTVTRRYVARLPTEAITQLLGRINTNPYRLQETTWPEDTVRFESLTASRKWTARGAKYFEVAYKFAIQPTYDFCFEEDADDYVGWNRIFRPDTGKWQYVVCAGDTTRGIYLHDDNVVQVNGGNETRGFALLFDERAR